MNRGINLSAALKNASENVFGVEAEVDIGTQGHIGANLHQVLNINKLRGLKISSQPFSHPISKTVIWLGQLMPVFAVLELVSRTLSRPRPSTSDECLWGYRAWVFGVDDAINQTSRLQSSATPQRLHVCKVHCLKWLGLQYSRGEQ